MVKLRHDAWTSDADAAIVATIKQPAVAVAAQLGRTVQAVEQRRSRLFARGVLPERGTRSHHALRTWTAEEDAIVAATVARPVGEVAALIPAHTANAILLRRRDLKARGVITGPRRRRWSPSEDELIRATMDRPRAEVAAALGRSAKAVTTRRSQLRNASAR